VSNSYKPVGEGQLRGADVSDQEYLEELGFQPVLSRVLGGFASFAIQWSTIAVIGATFSVFALGFDQIGPAMFWAWIVAGGLQVVVALCVAEDCSAYPLAGGGYNIVRRLSGRFLGWQTGWFLLLAHIISIPVATLAITPTIASWFGFNNLSHFDTLMVSGVLILAGTIVNLLSVRIASAFNTVGVSSELAAAVLGTVGVVIAILISGHATHSPSYLYTTGGTVHGSILLPLLYALLMGSWILNGFDVSGTAAEETKNATYTVPRGMVLSNVGSYIVGALLILVLVLSLGNVAGALGAPQPVTYILNPILGHPLAKTFEILAVASFFVNMIILQLAAARVIWAQARSGDLPGARVFASVNRHHVPVNAVIFAGVVGFAISLWSSLLVVLTAMSVCLWQIGYSLLLGSTIKAKRAGQFPKAAFRAKPGGLLFPLALVWSLFITGILIYQDPSQVGLGILGVFAAGVAIYRGLVTAGRFGAVADESVIVPIGVSHVSAGLARAEVMAATESPATDDR
jgi:amino acid transporter